VGEHFWDLGDDPGTPATWEPAPREVEPAVEPPEGAIYLRVAEALPDDVDQGIARIDPLAMEALGLAADFILPSFTTAGIQGIGINANNIRVPKDDTHASCSTRRGTKSRWSRTTPSRNRPQAQAARVAAAAEED
jgi:hypothetical protein